MIKEQKKDSLSMPFMTRVLYWGFVILFLVGGITGYKVYQNYERTEQLKELAVEAARKYVSGNSIVVKKTMNTSLSYLEDEGYLGSFDAACIENSYVGIKPNDEYQPVIHCGNAKKSRSNETSTYGIYEGILTYGVSVSPDNYTNQDVTVTITASEPVREVEGWTRSEDHKVLTKTITENTEINLVLVSEASENKVADVSFTVNSIDRVAASVEVRYSKTTLTNEDVLVTLVGNKRLRALDGWTLSKDSTTLTKTYTSNTEEDLEVLDLAGNVTPTHISIKNIDKEKPELMVSKSIYTITNGSVVVTITANEMVDRVDGWTLSEDRLTLTKTYSANTNETVTVRDIAGNEEKAQIIIDNIDSEAPMATVSYSTRELTKDPVVVTITATKEMQELEGWTLSSDKMSMTKSYDTNAKEIVFIKDLSGNVGSVAVEIINIDKTAPKVEATYDVTEPTTGKVTTTLTSNKELRELEGWTLAEDKMSMTKTYDENVNTSVTVMDLAGNETIVPVIITNIDHMAPQTTVSYSPNTWTNKDVTVTIKANELMQPVSGWTLSEDKMSMTKTYTTNTKETVEVKDLAGNMTSTIVDVKYIDRTAPKVEVSYTPDTKTRDQVTVTITSNKKLREVEGWTLSSDKRSLSKSYTENKKEVITVSDLAGNKVEASVNVTNIDHEGPKTTVSYSETKETNQDVTVTITSNEKMQPVSGWNLSEDGLTLSRKYGRNVDTTITVSDELGNTSDVKVKITNIDKTAPTLTVEYSETGATNKDVVVTITSNKPLQEKEGWDLSDDKLSMTKTYKENTNETVTISDKLGNTADAKIEIGNIDKTPAKIEVSYTPEGKTNGEVTVTLTSDKPLQEKEGWDLSDDKLSMTKTFTDPTDETVIVKDELGNETEVKVTVDQIDREAPKVQVSYSTTEPTKDGVMVTITSNEPMKELSGWTLSEDGLSMTKKYSSNVKGTITVSDLAGNESKVKVLIENIDKTAPETTVSYSPKSWTNKDVTVTITANEPMKEIDGWTLSKDKMSMTKVYSKNVKGTITVQDLVGNKTNTVVSINYIDKTAPKVEVSYTPDTKTRDQVTVTITANKKLRELEGWTRSEDKRSLSKTYSENTSETITVTDIAGNHTDAKVNVTNIDREGPKTTVSYSETEATNKDITVTITSNEPMKEVEGWDLSEDKLSMSKDYASNVNETITVSDELGNTSEVDIKINNIDREGPKTNVSYSETNTTNKDVTVTITSNEPMKEVEGWDLSEDKLSMSKDYASNVNETITVSDELGNTSEVTISINNIDKEGPKTSVSYSETNATNKDVTVTITSDEPMKEVEGWDLSEDKLSMKKKYASNVNETITVSDELGNTSEVAISINNIDKTPAKVTVSYDPNEKTAGNVTVTLTSDKAMQEIEGWTRSSDRKSMTKTYTENMKETVIVKDHVGNKTEVLVDVTMIDREGPEVKVSYSETNTTNKDVTVTITSNEPMKEVEGWDLSEDKLSMSKDYASNVNETITVSDELGNTSEVTISINNIDKEGPKTSVSYSKTAPTKNGVTVTITSNEPMKEVDGWTLSEDKMSMTKKYNENRVETVTVSDELGNTSEVVVSIKNIDKTAAKVTVSYDPNEKTAGNVTVTLTSDKAMQEIEGWTRSSDRKSMTKTYTENMKETVIVKDHVGNKTEVLVDVTMIDREGPEVKVSYSEKTPTTKDVIVTITSNEKLGELEGWTLSNDKMSMTKKYTENTTETITVSDELGNTSEVNIEIGNIDREGPIASVSYNVTAATNKDVIATITSNEPMKELSGWTLSEDKMSMTKKYNENRAETVTVSDELGNTSEVVVSIKNIDKTAAKVTVSYDPNEKTTGNVTVTLTSDKPMKEVDGWTRSEDHKSMTKTYTENMKETVIVKDHVGNKTEVLVDVTMIDREAPEVKVTYSTKEETSDKVVVTITSNEPMKEVPGWTLSDDKKSMSKEYTDNVNETITVSDLAGNESTVQVIIDNIDRIAPTLDVQYSTTKLTNEDVVVTITSDKKVKPLTGWTLSEDGKVLTKTYSSNITEIVKVEDLLGNGALATIEIRNIDADAPVAKVSYNPNEPTKENVVVTVTADEPVREIAGWTRSKDKKSLTKEYAENQSETITLIDAAGNSVDVVVTVDQIDRTNPTLNVAYSTTEPTQNPVTVTITSNEPMKEVSGWTLSEDKMSMTKDFDSNVDETVTVNDLAGNTIDIQIHIGNIDKDAPVTNVSYSTKALTNGTVTATITSNEPMQPVSGWTLAEDKMSMTKTYENSTTEYVLVKDLAGNITKTQVTIANIDKIAPELSIEYDNTEWTKDNVTATIYSNKKLQEVEGWILSKDKRSLTRTYGDNVTEKVSVKDIAGNIATITVNIKNIDKTAPVITVIDGDNSYTADFIKQIEVSKTEGFTNLEATAKDDADESVSVKVSGKVDRTTLGTYPVTYEAIDHVGHKTIVTASIEVVDSQAPVITLNGEESVTLGLGSKYTDQGATATDNYDASVNVTSTNNINNFQIGTYEVTYTATDASGNTATKVRTVSVVPGSASDLTRNINNCSTTGECYNKDATDNYVWYSGYLWRILKVNSDNTVKLVTEDSIAGFSYDDNSSSFKGSIAEDWLLNVFYPSLNNASTIITSGQYCNQPLLSTTSVRYNCSSDSIVTSRVGLLTMDEYNILGAESSFLNNGDHFFTMTPSKEGYVWVVQFDGTKKYTFSVTNPYAMRPVITLKADAKVRTGNGTKGNPFRLENDYSANPNTSLNARKTGEYVRFANKNWRIVSTGSTTKLVLDANYITNGTYAKMTYGDSATFSLTKGIGQYLNTTVYNDLFSTTDKEYLTSTNYYFSSYRLGNNPRTTSLTASGTKVNAYVGLNNVGELMSGSSNTSRTPNFTSWLLNYNSYNNNVWFTSSAGTSDYSSISDIRGIRPTITLKSTVRITSGNGTSTSPYVIAY